jgi:proteasome assembly chaperone 2
LELWSGSPHLPFPHLATRTSHRRPQKPTTQTTAPGPKLFLLQQRAPVIPGRQRAFAANLAAWLAAAGVAQVVVLSGLDAQFRREAQLEGSQVRFLAATEFLAAATAAAPGGSGGGDAATTTAAAAAAAAAAADTAAADAEARRLAGLKLSAPESAAAQSLASLGVTRLEPDAVGRELELHSKLPPWPLLAALAEAKVPATLLGRFASEGDNVPDALALAGVALQLLAAQKLAEAAGGAKLKTPTSWAGLYGRPREEVA